MGAVDRHAGQDALPGIGRALTARCSGCREAKPHSKFGRDPNKRNGRTSRCNACKNKAVERWKARNKEKYRQIYKNWRTKNKQRIDAEVRMKLYGVTEEQHAAALKEQGGACAICGDETKLHVDHCHSSGTFRGLLCSRCNTGLGHFKDDPRRLAAAIQYLERVAGI